MSAAPYKLAGMRLTDLDRLYPTDEVQMLHAAPRSRREFYPTSSVEHDQTAGEVLRERPRLVNRKTRPLPACRAAWHAARHILAAVGFGALMAIADVMPVWIIALDAAGLTGAWYALYRWYRRQR